jgi:cellulose synthase/poly-beta-1,6-N-acetylglucosamine synthase-like glycosyltransferase
MVTILGILFAAFAALLIYPYIVYPVILSFISEDGSRRLENTKHALPAKPSKIDIVFCAYNEERCIREKIEDCLAIARRYGNVTVHAYSDGSTDRTNQILASYSSQVNAIISSVRLGKSVGMNSLLEQCRGDLVVFTDANTTLDLDNFGNIAPHFEDPTIGCICGHLRYENEVESDVAWVGSQYWKFEEELKLVESRSGSTVGADGALFVIRRELFKSVPADIIDDTFTSLSILCDGWRVVQVTNVIANERVVTRSGEEFARKRRIGCRCFNCHRLLWPRLRALPPIILFKYLSHKFIRWFSGLWLVLSMLTWMGFLLVIGAFSLTIGSLLLLAIVYFSDQLGFASLTRLREAMLAMIATSTGVFQSLRGERYQVWKIAPSSRKSI